MQATTRNFFLEGVNQITQWDIASPGCDQCMRLLDYYGRVALQADDRELLLILNTVITAKIRQNLQGQNGSYKQTNYPYACEALEQIKPLREADGRAQTERKRKRTPKP
jgi:predicted SprT family Zn-dependent metalloprotease